MYFLTRIVYNFIEIRCFLDCFPVLFRENLIKSILTLFSKKDFFLIGLSFIPAGKIIPVWSVFIDILKGVSASWE